MPNHPIYVRIATENEVPYFKNRSAAEAVIGVVIDAPNQEWMQLHGFVVLPEALEFVATPIKQGVTGLIAHIQAETIPPLAILLPNATGIWERHFMQIPLGTQRALDARLAMLLLAPVAGGIVDMAAGYPYSSANSRYAASVTVYSDFIKHSTVEVAKITEAPKPSGASSVA